VLLDDAPLRWGKIRQDGGRQRRHSGGERIAAEHPGTDVCGPEGCQALSKSILSPTAGPRRAVALSRRAGAHAYSDRLDGVYAVDVARANAPEHRIDRISATAAVLAAGVHTEADTMFISETLKAYCDQANEATSSSL
jgi:hypothetical protein